MNFGVSDLIEARGRFENFYDAVVVSWQFGTQGRGTYKNGVEQSKAFVEFVIETQDNTNAMGSRVTIRMIGCSSIVLHRTNTEYFDVLSSGLHVLGEGSAVGLEFGDFHEAPLTIKDLQSSRFHVVAETLSWQVSPLS